MSLSKKHQFTTSILPDHVIHYDILTRLPAKSLLRFKSVCKYWYDFINSSIFLDIYRKYVIETRDCYSSSDDLLIVNNIILYSNNCDQLLYYFYGPQFSREISVKFDTQFDFTRTWILHVSCYNGVVCVRFLHDFALCNPLTKEYRKIINPRSYYKYPLIHCNYGFGYDSVSDDYKIIIIPALVGDVTHIYSTRANSWKKGNKRRATLRYIKNEGTCTVNNKLHYISVMALPLRTKVKIKMPAMSRASSKKYLSVFTIDLHTEKFKSMSLPIKLIEDDDYEGCRLIASNGRLYFSMSDIKSLPATIWVMKEYGVTESWTKLYELEGDIVQSKIISYNLSKEGGEVLVVEDDNEESDELVWYNLEDKSFRKVSVPGKRKYNYNHCVCMKGSLAPILGSTAMTNVKV